MTDARDMGNAEGRLAELLSAVGDVALAGRAATGYSGRIDVDRGRAIFEALHNIGHVHGSAARGDVERALSTLSWTRDAFAAMPEDTTGRERMLAALDAYRAALVPAAAATTGEAFPASFLR